MDKVELYLEYLKIEKQYSTNTIEAYKRDINQFISFVDDVEVSEEMIDKYIMFLRENYTNNTYLRKISALKNFYKYLHSEQLITTNYFKELSISKKKIDIPKYLTADEINFFLNSLETNSNIDLRNKAMFELLYATGMRISELINVKLNDVKLQDQLIKVEGKGKKQRLIPLNNTTIKYLNMYIEIAYPKLNKYNLEYLFLSKNFKPITRQGFYKVVKEKANIVGIKNLTPHVFRHSIATHMLNNGANLRIIQEILGHENLSTTEIYAKVSNDLMKKEYEKFHPLNKRK